MSRRRHPSRHGSPRGFTLAELMIALVLFGLIMAAIMQVLAQQQRYNRSANEVMEMRGQMRHATYALPVDLRAIFPAGGDVTDWTSSSIAFRAFSGSSVLCAKPAANAIILPPASLNKGNTLTAWLSRPVAGDSILVHDENVLVGNADDVWRAHEITLVASAAGTCPTTTGFTVAADAAKLNLQLTIAPNLSSTVVVGAPVRIYRQVEYELYKAGDGRFYLGVSDCLPGRTPECSDAVPVGGPFLDLVDGDPDLSGLSLRYFTEDGTELDPASDDPAKIVRIEIVVRGHTQTPLSTSTAKGEYSDSLTFVIGLRNR